MPDAREEVREWLLNYAWAGTKDEQIRTVECIMHHEGWKHIDAVADKFAGAQEESGPKAFSEGVEFALSALYECHDKPHLQTCPYWKETQQDVQAR